MCRSQQPQSPTWNLEPRQPGGGGGGGAAALTTATGCRDRGAPGPDGSPWTVLSLCPVGDLHAPLPSIIVAQISLVKFPSICSHLLPAPPLQDPFDHTQLSPPKTAVLRFNHLWMWVEVGGGFEGVEAKTTHYIMYLLIQGC